MQIGLGTAINKTYKKIGAAAGNYQAWAGYPNSSYSSIIYPYQVIISVSGTIYLVYCAFKMYQLAGGKAIYTNPSTLSRVDKISGGVWIQHSGQVSSDTPWTSANSITFVEANNNIFTDSGYTAVRFAKTT